jgi:molybdate transport system ATP-binding protein
MSRELAANFSKKFNGGPVIAAEFQAATEAGVTVLFGPSGAGKTTILRCLAGLEQPNDGFIRWGEETWFDAERGIFLAPQRRGIGLVAQDCALFPHLTAGGNIGFGLGHLIPVERQHRVMELGRIFDVAHLLERRPSQLSGGERQRIALARAMAPRPRLLLLDEPLGAIDAPAREQLRHELGRWLCRLAIPAVLVTHDRVEALALGDQVVVVHNGRVRQGGPVHEVFAYPADPEVARIVGVETVQPGKVISLDNGLATVEVGSIRLVAIDRGIQTGDCAVCIRAEEVTLEKGPVPPTSARNRLAGVIRGLMKEGAMVRVSVDCGFRLQALVTRQSCQELDLREGETITALIKAPAIQIVTRSSAPKR